MISPAGRNRRMRFARPLRALIVEDSENDTLLLVRHLNQAGYEVTYEQVWTEETMREALAHDGWDVVLSDFSPQPAAMVEAATTSASARGPRGLRARWIIEARI